MDNMNTMDFNQKIDVSLRASLEATPVERNASDDLSTGSSSDGFWNLIVLYTGSPQTLQNEFPSSSFTFLLGNYAIVKISEDDIPSLAAFPQVILPQRIHLESSITEIPYSLYVIALTGHANLHGLFKCAIAL